MEMLQGNTYLKPVRVEDSKGNVVTADRVAKVEIVFGDLYKYYGTEDGEVVWNDAEKCFVVPLTEEDTFSLEGAVECQVRAVLVDGSVSGSKPEGHYVYESKSKTRLSDGGAGDESGELLTLRLLKEFAYIGGGTGEGGTSDYNELTNKPSINGVELKGNKTTEDLGIVSKETDPTVPQHVKNITEQDINEWNSKANKSDIPDVSQLAEKSELPTKVSQLQNDRNYATQGYVDAKVANLVNSAPETLDTLGEVAKAIEENADVVEALNSAVGSKANKSELAEYVKNTDYATNEKAGITRIDQNFGIRMGGNNQDVAVIVPATTVQIDGGTDQYHPIVPSTLKYGVEKYATPKEIVAPSYITGFKDNVVKSNVVRLKSYSLSVPRYYKLCEFLQRTDELNYSSISIEGRMGGWVSTDIAQWEILFSNRNSYASVSSVLSLSSSDGLTMCDLVVYEQEDKSCVMYLKCFQYYTTNFEISTINCNNVYDGTYSTEEPTGTLKWSLSTSDYVKVNELVSQEDFDKLVNNEIQIVDSNGSLKLANAYIAGNLGANAIAIGNNSRAIYQDTVAIGTNAIASGGEGTIAIGQNAKCYGDYDVVIGQNAIADSSASGKHIAIGYNAKTQVSTYRSIQLGSGTNKTSDTLQIYEDNIYNHSTHTLTVQNIELNGVDLGTQLGDLNTALEAILGV